MQLGSALTLSGLEITQAKYTGTSFPEGGCIYSEGSVTLQDSTVSLCYLTPTSGAYTNKGGAIFARGEVSMSNSVVSDSQIFSHTVAYGAGIYTMSGVSMTNSTVSGNTAHGADNLTAKGGGIFAASGLEMVKSNIKYNSAIQGAGGEESRGGGAYFSGGGEVAVKYSTFSGNQAAINSALLVGFDGVIPGSYVVLMQDSTISGNTASDFQSVGTYLPTTVDNSTIAFNKAAFSLSFSPVGLYSQLAISTQSSIFANNIAADGGDNDLESQAGITGLNNLVVFTDRFGSTLGTS